MSFLPWKFRHIARHIDRPCRFSSDEEVKALQIINIALKQSPQSYTLLHVQCDFLRTKGRLDWALQLAKEAVNCAPSEFVTWAKLTEVYVEMGEYENVRPELSSGTLALSAGLTVAPPRPGQALLTLNSCPMFTYNERDLHRMPTPARTHTPVRSFIAESNILDEESALDNEVRRSSKLRRFAEADAQRFDPNW